MKRVSLLAVFMLAGTLAYGQANTCAYTFSFPEHSFQFCLTGVGTLAMLQSPIGVNHLDTENPIEGWTWEFAGTVIDRGGDLFIGGEQCALTWKFLLPAPTVTQPNGPGTLPIRFDWHGEGNAVGNRYRCTQTKVDCDEGGYACEWRSLSRRFTRLTTLRLDGKSVNKFRHLRPECLHMWIKGRLS